jgi:hypothetical protein
MNYLIHIIYSSLYLIILKIESDNYLIYLVIFDMNIVTKRTMSTIRRHIITSTKNFSKHNSQFLDEINIKINYKQSEFWQTHRYESTISFRKNNMDITKRFKDNDFDQLMKELNSFIEHEIKV